MQEAGCVSEALPLPAAKRLQSLAQQHPLVTSISSGGGFGWQICSSALEVFSLPSAQRIGAWNFGSSLKDMTTRVTAVTEFSKRSLLVASYNETVETSSLCVFDIKLSQVVHAIEMPYMVTSVKVVSRSMSSHSPLLTSPLASFSGLVAVGCHTGRVYLLDLTCEDLPRSDETCPHHTERLENLQPSVEHQRQMALSRQAHLSILLTEGNHVDGSYFYRKPDGIALLSYAEDDICVSSLEYISQTGLLAVGLSVGCFHLFSLPALKLEYSSRHTADELPITHFTFQEPENDPRNFCYLWVVHSPVSASEREVGESSATLYQMGFVHKNWYEGHGSLYKELSSVGPRFEHQLGMDPYCGESGGESRVLACYTLANNNTPSQAACSDISLEEGSSVDLSLCIIVWEVVRSGPNNLVFLAVFDMNRWYHAQMPTSVRLFSEQCPYLAVCALNSGLPADSNDNIQAAFVGAQNTSRFKSPYLPPPEQHFYPSALALEVCLVTSLSVVHARFLGTQRLILAEMVHRGPSCLMDVDGQFEACLRAGLLPRAVDAASLQLVQSKKRELLLTMAVDHSLVSFITAAINKWASTEFVRHGCTMRMLLEWAWDKVAFIKEKIDRLCVHLYDWSGAGLDQQSLQILHQNQTCLSNMVTVFETLASCESNITQQGLEELESRLCVVTLLRDHLNMVLGFYAMGLLPETPVEDVLAKSEDGCPFPSKALQDAYNQRRQQISHLHSDVEPHQVLLIDGLVKELGAGVRQVWASDGRSNPYPPSSFHSVLSLYLVQGIAMSEKHLLVYYLFCDLLALTPEQAQPKVCRLPASINKLVQGMWLLDHREFQDALVYLLDPVVQDQVLPWQHRCIMKAFVYQGHSALALRYLRVRQPPVLSEEDIKLRLTVLLANELTWEAVDYQRRCRDQINATDLLSHLITASLQTGTVERLLQLPWSHTEEKLLLACLGPQSGSQENSHKELLVMYFLQRARFTEAARHNAQITGSLDLGGRERARVRNAIVEGYQRVLPAVQRKLTMTGGALRSAMHNGRQVVRPKPLSTTVYAEARKTAVTRAFLLGAVLDKVREVKVADPMEPCTSKDDRYDEEDVNDLEAFLGTSRVPKNHSVIESVASEMVFPTPTKPTPVSITPPLMKRAADSTMAHHTPTLSRSLKRKSHLFSAEALCMLRTPPVIHRQRPKQAPSKSLFDLEDPLASEGLLSTPKHRHKDVGTPRSILKEPGTPVLLRKDTSTPKSILKETSTPEFNRKDSSKSLTTRPCTPRSILKESSTPQALHRGNNTPKSIRFGDESPSPPAVEDKVANVETPLRPPSPPLVRTSFRDFSSYSIAWPTPPVPSRLSQITLPNNDDTEAEQSSFTFGTPKQLRFVEPVENEDSDEDEVQVASENTTTARKSSLLDSVRRASSRLAQQQEREGGRGSDNTAGPHISVSRTATWEDPHKSSSSQVAKEPPLASASQGLFAGATVNYPETDSDSNGSSVISYPDVEDLEEIEDDSTEEEMELRSNLVDQPEETEEMVEDVVCEDSDEVMEVDSEVIDQHDLPDKITSEVVPAERAEAAEVVQTESAEAAKVVQAESAEAAEVVQSESVEAAEVVQAESVEAAKVVQAESVEAAKVVQSESVEAAEVVQAEGVEAAEVVQAEGVEAAEVVQAESVEAAKVVQAESVEAAEEDDKMDETGGTLVMESSSDEEAAHTNQGEIPIHTVSVVTHTSDSSEPQPGEDLEPDTDASLQPMAQASIDSPSRDSPPPVTEFHLDGVSEPVKNVSPSVNVEIKEGSTDLDGIQESVADVDAVESTASPDVQVLSDATENEIDAGSNVSDAPEDTTSDFMCESKPQVILKLSDLTSHSSDLLDKHSEFDVQSDDLDGQLADLPEQSDVLAGYPSNFVRQTGDSRITLLTTAIELNEESVHEATRNEMETVDSARDEVMEGISDTAAEPTIQPTTVEPVSDAVAPEAQQVATDTMAPAAVEQPIETSPSVAKELAEIAAAVEPAREANVPEHVADRAQPVEPDTAAAPGTPRRKPASARKTTPSRRSSRIRMISETSDGTTIDSPRRSTRSSKTPHTTPAKVPSSPARKTPTIAARKLLTPAKLSPPQEVSEAATLHSSPSRRKTAPVAINETAGRRTRRSIEATKLLTPSKLSPKQTDGVATRTSPRSTKSTKPIEKTDNVRSMKRSTGARKLPTPAKGSTEKEVAEAESNSATTDTLEKAATPVKTAVVSKTRGGSRRRLSTRGKVTMSKEDVEQALLASQQASDPVTEVVPEKTKSRDTSPEAHQTSDTESAMAEEEFRSSADFVFSEPMMVDDGYEMEGIVETKVKSFVFSPPLTRERCRRVSLDTPTLTPIDLRRQSLESTATRRQSTEGVSSSPSTPRRRSLGKKVTATPDADPASSPARNTRSAKLKKSHNTRSTRSPADSLNLLAPVPEEEVSNVSPLSRYGTKGALPLPAASKPVTRPRRRKTLKW